MLRDIRPTIWLPVALTALAGCAAVNPRVDYERVERHITEATGQDRVYRPDEEARAAEIVAGLLKDGITAAEAVETALLNSPGFQAAFMDVGMARADAVQAGLFSNPFVGISARFPDGGGLANIEAAVAQNIAELWRIPARRRAADRSLDAAIVDLARKAAAIAADAKAAYYEAIGADDLHRIAQENLVIAQELLALSLTRQEAGAANELDVNLSRSLALSADVEVARSRLAAADARRTLATLLGLVTPADTLVLVDSLPDAYPEIAEVASLVELAKSWRLDLRAAREAVALAQARLDEQNLLVFPVVELGLELEREDRRAQGGRNVLADTARASIASGGLKAPKIQPRSERRSAGGQNTIFGPSLGIELPIFDQNQAQIAKAQYALRQARKNLDAVDRAVTQEVRGATDRALTAWRLMRKLREQSIPLARRNLELSREAYLAGRASFLSVLEAQRFALEARSGLVRATRSAATAIPELERTIGLPFARLLAGITTEPAPGAAATEDIQP